MKIRFEWKPEDMWIGVFWRRTERKYDVQLDVWICFIPCVPLHLTMDVLRG